MPRIALDPEEKRKRTVISSTLYKKKNPEKHRAHSIEYYKRHKDEVAARRKEKRLNDKFVKALEQFIHA